MGRAAPLVASELVGISLSGGYRLERLLDADGLGVVFEGSAPGGKRVALKVLRREVVTEGTLSRLSREASVTSKIENRHIVPILSAGQDLERDLAYLVIPLLEGVDVRALLAKMGPLPPDTAVRIALQVASGLSAVHAAGIVYRDVRPSRIFLETRSDGEVTARVFGFGLPKGEDPAWTPGGRSHMRSKSEVREGADPRLDVFGLGAALYEMLSGVAPWAQLDVTPDTEDIGPADAQAEGQGQRALMEPQFPSIQDRAPWIQAKLATALTLALSSDVDRRHPSIEALAEALRGTVVDLPAGGEERVTADMLRPLKEEERDQTAARADSQTDPLIGHELGGRYTVRRLIGRGGMGAVYEAEAHEGHRVAAKVIFRGISGQDDEAVRRFIREARAVTAIESPHVVRTFELGTDITLGSPFIIMELLGGIDLGKLLRQRGPLEPRPLLRVFIQAARGLAAAHAEGIVHRDVKPGNLFLHLEEDDADPQGGLARTSRGSNPRDERRIVVKVCDFGIAKRADEAVSHELTRTGGVLGSPIYMSPEQAKQARDVDRRSDVWSLSVSLYQALCGSCPWDPNASLTELLVAICTERVPPLLEAAPWLDPALAADVHRGLAKDPAERWQSMEEMIAALLQHGGGDDEVTFGELRAIDAERRAAATPMAKLRASARLTQSGEERSIGGSALPTAGAPVGAGRRRVIGAAATLATVVMIAGVVALRGSTPSANRRGPAMDAAEATSGVDERANARLAASAVEAALLTATVQVPADALVRVNGEARGITGGHLALRGRAGDMFEVEIVREGVKKTAKVFLTSSGKAEPDRIELGEGPGTKPRGPRAPGARGASTSAAEASTPTQPPVPIPVKPVEHW